MISNITEENWTTTRYAEGDLFAFVAMGAKPSETNDKSDNCDLIYSVIVTNKDYEEISDQMFDSLPEALISINNRFGHWSFTSLASKNEGGCSTCAAH